MKKRLRKKLRDKSRKSHQRETPFKIDELIQAHRAILDSLPAYSTAPSFFYGPNRKKIHTPHDLDEFMIEAAQ